MDLKIIEALQDLLYHHMDTSEGVLLAQDDNGAWNILLRLDGGFTTIDDAREVAEEVFRGPLTDLIEIVRSGV